MIPHGVPYDEAMRQFRWTVPERFNIGRAVCERHEPDTLAMIVENADGSVRHWTFGQLLAASSRLANALAARGISKGDRVARVPEPERGAHDLPSRRLPHGRGRAAAVHPVRRGGARVSHEQRRGLGADHRHEPAAQGAGGARAAAASQDHHRDRRRQAHGADFLDWDRLLGRGLRPVRDRRHRSRGSGAADLHLGHDRPAQGRAARASHDARLHPGGRADGSATGRAATRSCGRRPNGRGSPASTTRCSRPGTTARRCWRIASPSSIPSAPSPCWPSTGSA